VEEVDETENAQLELCAATGAARKARSRRTVGIARDRGIVGR